MKHEWRKPQPLDIKNIVDDESDSTSTSIKTNDSSLENNSKSTRMQIPKLKKKI
jgi:hypothetical protein